MQQTSTKAALVQAAIEWAARSGTEGRAQAGGDCMEMDPFKQKAWQKDWLWHRENVDLSPD